MHASVFLAEPEHPIIMASTMTNADMAINLFVHAIFHTLVIFRISLIILALMLFKRIRKEFARPYKTSGFFFL